MILRCAGSTTQATQGRDFGADDSMSTHTRKAEKRVRGANKKNHLVSMNRGPRFECAALNISLERIWKLSLITPTADEDCHLHLIQHSVRSMLA